MSELREVSLVSEEHVNLEKYDGILVKESSDASRGHQRMVFVEKGKTKVKVTVTMEGDENEPIEFFISQNINLHQGQWRTTKKSPTVASGTEFTHYLMIKDLKFWVESEKVGQEWESIVNGMLSKILAEIEQGPATTCSLQ